MTNFDTQVDIVYLWVDSKDKIWQEKRRQSFEIFLKNNKNSIAPYANTNGRFRDNGELIFNLRCLEKFFPDHGQVYIVTDEQRPDWLAFNDKITIIDHQDIIPKKISPIFSSANIESYIQNIPNLSENFFYLNDDVFFGSTVDIDWWFGDKLKYFYSTKSHKNYKEMQPFELSPINGSIIANEWLSKKYHDYQHQTKIMAHSPKPFVKSFLFEIEEIAKDLFYKIRSKNFRTWNTPGIIGDFVPRWLEYRRIAEIIQIDELYIESGDYKIETKLNLLSKKFGKVPFFCINDTCDDADLFDKRLVLIKKVMQKLLPNKSRFEK